MKRGSLRSAAMENHRATDPEIHGPVILGGYGGSMLKACTYCGRIHESQYNCPSKLAISRKYPKDTQAALTRNSSRWQKTRGYIRLRDHGVCQLCLKEYTGDIKPSRPVAVRPYESEELSVHHITRLEDDIDKAFDTDNLITLCRVHHELAEAGKISPSVLRRIAQQNNEAFEKM